jgi:ATP-dependent protease ClpP protease subunit
MYGPISRYSFFGISAASVAQVLDALPDTVTTVQLRINSPGGDAFEGITISNMLRAHAAKVVGVVDGLAASAASIVATACEELVMSPGSMLMIHDASMIAWGNADVLRKEATTLDALSDSCADVYQTKAGGTAETWRELMREETWYGAKAAVKAGLADRVGVVASSDTAETASPDDVEVDDEEAAASAEARIAAWDLSMFRHPPTLSSADDRAPNPPTASADGHTETEGGSAVAFTDAQITAMRQKLGVAEDADETAIVAALDEALDERAEPTSTNVPEGHVVVPEARLTDLEAAAQQGVSAAKTLHERDREAFLNANRTKFAPANREAWAKEYDRDPEGTRKHFESAAEIIPVAELGHDNPVDEANSEEDAVYTDLFGADEKVGA